MKKMIMMLCISAVVLIAAPGALAQGQDLTGTWQGTIHAPGRDLRTVVKISKGADGSLKAVLYSIDQGGQGIAASAVSIQDSNVKYAIDAIGGSYEGKLSADGNTIDGTWTQGKGNLPLTLMRATPETAWAIPEPPKPMAADADPSFDVATIKPSNPDQPGKAFLVRGRQFSTVNTTLSDLITFAYGLHPKQLEGGPDWLNKDKFDLLAKPDGEGQPNDKQWKIMIQKLLADRFQLKFHNDKEDLSVYAIVVAKDGPKLNKSGGDPNGLPGLFFRGLGDLPARNATMADFAGLLQSAVLDKPVVDQTGLQGRFDFTLKWTPDEFQFAGIGVKPPPPADTADAPPDLFTAMQQQLGLKLDSTKAPVNVLVIDQAAQPTPN
jgi:uncharacterized protein (TIGR03435 family)